MHEFSYVRQVYKQVQRHVVSRQAKRVISVRLSVSSLSGIERDPFVFYWKEITRNTALADSKLYIRNVTTNVLCTSCRKTFTLTKHEDILARCAFCQSIKTIVAEEITLKISSIKIEI